MRGSRVVATAVAVMLSAAFGWAQRSQFWIERDHPAIEYSKRPAHDAVRRLNERVATGELALRFASTPRQHLESVLHALEVPVSSQTLVFSENSLQRAHISMKTPRAIYFNDTVAVGWVPGADTIEAAAFDRQQGVHFYSIPQTPQAKPQFVQRDGECMRCHLLPETSGVPGLLAMSVLPLSDNPNEYAEGWGTDHSTPFADRWGGWFVTGVKVPARHLGNVPVLHVPKSYVRAAQAPQLTSMHGTVDVSAYPSPHSDVVALLVLNHQLHIINLLTRLGWEARMAAHEGRSTLPSDAQRIARNLVDYMLFVDEVPLPSPVQGSSSFAKDFPARGPRDKQGRSLRDFDLTRRVFRYPCSYMIYSEAFEALPTMAKTFVYERMSDVLSGAAKDPQFAVLTPADRRAVIEILRDTKPDLPPAFAR